MRRRVLICAVAVALLAGGALSCQRSTAAPGHIVDAHGFDDLQVIQRDRFGHGGLTVWGAYAGRPEPIHARVVPWTGGDPIVDWTLLDAQPAGGAFVGRLEGIPQGGWYRLELRSGEGTPTAVDRRFGVGVLVACAGQSNAERWFTRGSAHTSATVGVLRARRWGEAHTGGAVVFGESLSRDLGVPVGLLEAATGSTGLAASLDRDRSWMTETGRGGPYDEYQRLARAADSEIGLVVWVQGEADARAGVGSADYEERLSRLWSRMKSDVGGVDPPLVIYPIQAVAQETSASMGSHSAWEAVLSAQGRLAADQDDVAICPAAPDLERDGLLHFTPEGYAEMGRRFAATAADVLGRRPPSKTRRCLKRSVEHIPPDRVTRVSDP